VGPIERRKPHVLVLADDAALRASVLDPVFSAFSDNFLKNVLVFLLVFKITGPQAEALTQLAAAVFIAPYFFLSALGGEMADRFDKARVAHASSLRKSESPSLQSLASGCIRTTTKRSRLPPSSSRCSCSG
jgi:MFS family permease